VGLERVIKSRRVYALFLLPFLLAGVAVARRYAGGELLPCGEGGIIPLPFIERFQGSQWLSWAGLSWLLLLSYSLFFMADHYKMLPGTTSLPAVIYALLGVGIFCRHGASAYMVAALLVAVALARLHASITRLKSNASIFDFGLLIAMAVLLCPKLVLLAPWAILVLPFSGRSTFKDMTALFLGFFVALLFVFACFFLFGGWEGLPGRFADASRVGEWLDYRLSPLQWVATALLLVLALVSVVHALVHTSSSIVSRRRGLLAVVSLLLVLGATIFFVPLGCPAFLFVLFIPLSFLYARYFISYQGRWLGNTLFLLLLVASLFMVV
jgi:hypothetical protein